MECVLTFGRGLVRCFFAAGISSSWSGIASLAALLAIRLLQHAGYFFTGLALGVSESIIPSFL